MAQKEARLCEPGLLRFYLRAFFFGSAFFCAELFFWVGLFFLGSTFFFDIDLNLRLVNYLLVAAQSISSRSYMLSFQKRQPYSQSVGEQRYTYNGKSKFNHG